MKSKHFEFAHYFLDFGTRCFVIISESGVCLRSLGCASKKVSCNKKSDAVTIEWGVGGEFDRNVTRCVECDMWQWQGRDGGLAAY